MLPELLEKCFERDWRVYVECAGKAGAQKIDKLLWHYKNDGFLPHAIEDSPQAMRKNFDQQQFAEMQPILIGTNKTNINNASIRFLLDGMSIEDDNVTNYERLIVMFDGTDEASVLQARKQWKQFKSIPNGSLTSITYWQQANSGKWEKKA